MTALPRLIGAILNNKPGEPLFSARLGGDKDSVCSIEVDDVLQAGLMQVALSTRISTLWPQYFGLASTAKSRPSERKYVVEFNLPNTPVPAGVEVIKTLFEKDLDAQYWYQLASTALLCAKLDPASGRVTFLLQPENAANKPANWQQFAEQLLSVSDRCGEVHAKADRVQVVLTAESWEKWEEVLPQLAALFPA